MQTGIAHLLDTIKHTLRDPRRLAYPTASAPVSDALAPPGYRLYGSPAVTFDGRHVIVAQALQ